MQQQQRMNQLPRKQERILDDAKGSFYDLFLCLTLAAAVGIYQIPREISM
jgi:hypothetical protein